MIQVIGSKKDRRTQKIQRYAAERKIKIHLRDISEKPLSEGELDNCAQVLGGHKNLIDQDSLAYQKRGLAHMDFQAREELLANVMLLKIPIVRVDKKAWLQPDDAVLAQIFT